MRKFYNTKRENQQSELLDRITELESTLTNDRQNFTALESQTITDRVKIVSLEKSLENHVTKDEYHTFQETIGKLQESLTNLNDKFQFFNQEFNDSKQLIHNLEEKLESKEKLLESIQNLQTKEIQHVDSLVTQYTLNTKKIEGFEYQLIHDSENKNILEQSYNHKMSYLEQKIQLLIDKLLNNQCNSIEVPIDETLDITLETKESDLEPTIESLQTQALADKQKIQLLERQAKIDREKIQLLEKFMNKQKMSHSPINPLSPDPETMFFREESQGTCSSVMSSVLSNDLFSNAPMEPVTSFPYQPLSKQDSNESLESIEDEILAARNENKSFDIQNFTWEAKCNDSKEFNKNEQIVPEIKEEPETNEEILENIKKAKVEEKEKLEVSEKMKKEVENENTVQEESIHEALEKTSSNKEEGEKKYIEGEGKDTSSTEEEEKVLDSNKEVELQLSTETTCSDSYLKKYE